ncbi:MAG: mechanosensitive ion channel, partial [Planctomycetales bacterium]|nr:mechanosensitive ion channel [Planctomycetales bacterium]
TEPSSRSDNATTDEGTAKEDTQTASAPKVEIEPVAEDDQIARRLTDILEATTWFENPAVRVDEGVAFLRGLTHQSDYRTWAGDLARNTQDVVAVVNRIEVTERSMWDMTPAWSELRKLGREAIQMLPLLGLAALLLIGTWFAAGWSTWLARSLLKRRVKNSLLIGVFSRAVAIPVFLLGLYLALRVSGLTQMAATVLGGTGLIGLFLGIAFRDIAENFLASILISIQRPFALGDLIEVEGNMGLVQSVTARGTLLMTPEGNHVQIPNSSIYKNIILNLTANPNMRCDFAVGIDYADPTIKAQETILKVLHEHEAVLRTPEPMVLVEELGASTVNLRVYFWINAQVHSKLKVRSSIIRLTKLAIEDAGMSMPDESREVIFPKGVPVRMIDESVERKQAPRVIEQRLDNHTEERSQSTTAEDGLGSEQASLEEQAREARKPEMGANLLEE